MKLRRPHAVHRCALAVLSATVLAACAGRPPHRYFQPTPDQIGVFPNSYGEVVAPRRGLIAVQGDDLAYGLAPGRSRRAINGADQGQGPLTISETLRKVLRGVQVENRGFPGDTVASGAARWAAAPHADLLILAYGFGDEQAHTSVQAYSDALTAMVEAAQANGEAVFIVVPPNVSKPLLENGLSPYQAVDRNVATATGVTAFEANAAVARIKAPAPRGFAQTPSVYQAIAADITPYIKILGAPASRGER